MSIKGQKRKFFSRLSSLGFNFLQEFVRLLSPFRISNWIEFIGIPMIEFNRIEIPIGLNSIENLELSSTLFSTRLIVWVESSYWFETSFIKYWVRDVFPEIFEIIIWIYGFSDSFLHNLGIWPVQKSNFNHFWAISVSKLSKLYNEIKNINQSNRIELSWTELNIQFDWNFLIDLIIEFNSFELPPTEFNSKLDCSTRINRVRNLALAPELVTNFHSF